MAQPLSHTLWHLFDSAPSYHGCGEALKVFLLIGQSNMEEHGFAGAERKRNEGKGSLEYLTKDEATAEKYKHLLDADG